MEDNFDAIVVGSGISGGWAAKELCEKGLRTIVLERGDNVEHIKDYPTAFKNPWDFEFGLTNSQKAIEENPIQSQAFNEGDQHFYVKDKDHPYIQVNPFNWIRGYQVGGRSLTWGRQCYRLSNLDFEANKKEGIAIDWPIRYKDIAPWYDYVEEYVGVSGNNDGIDYLPDGKFLPPIEMNCIESYFKKETEKRYKDRFVIIGRSANLTKRVNDRGPCQYRNLCSRGCPFAGYFSSNSSTIPDAQATGNLTLATNMIVSKIIYDPVKKRAVGVKVINSKTKETHNIFAKVIFLNASTIATAAILLHSKSDNFPNGLGNSSDQIGRNLMDHFVRAGAKGEYKGFENKYYYGRNPTNIYIPRFRNINEETKQENFVRGYGFQGTGLREGWSDMATKTKGFGESFLEKVLRPGPWTLTIGAWGETLPYTDNRVTLDSAKSDKWGLPLVKIDMKYHRNEEEMRKDILKTSFEMLQKARFTNIKNFDYTRPPGSAVHEMGTARMGNDPKTSVLNEYNQMHDVPNVFISDGSCMTSSANQNPSLTYMALTARACNHAAILLKNGNFS